MNFERFQKNFLSTGFLLLLSSVSAFADVPLRGFGQIGYVSTNTDSNGVTSNSNSFYNGALDLFLTGNLSKKVLFLSEVGFEISEQNATNTDIERLSVQYVYSPWLKVGAGRFHTALGYWNDNYHHGSWLHTTVGRPLIYRFEDGGGILPTHTEGIELRGEGDVATGRLGYIVNLGNGRGPQVDPPQVANDKDQSKAVSALLYYVVNNFRFGAGYYDDTMPGCTYDASITDPSQITECSFKTGVSAFRAKGKEKIYSGHLVYGNDELEAILEYFKITHTFTTGESDSTINGGYLQLSYRVGEWTPYYRYDLIDVPDTKLDAYTLREGKTTGHTVGIRYELDSASALKFEYVGTEVKHNLNADLTVNTTTDKNASVFANWSFTF